MSFVRADQYQVVEGTKTHAAYTMCAPLLLPLLLSNLRALPAITGAEMLAIYRLSILMTWWLVQCVAAWLAVVHIGRYESVFLLLAYQKAAMICFASSLFKLWWDLVAQDWLECSCCVLTVFLVKKLFKAVNVSKNCNDIWFAWGNPIIHRKYGSIWIIHIRSWWNRDIKSFLKCSTWNALRYILNALGVIASILITRIEQ